MTSSRTALVVGGAVAGPTVAMALQQAGLHPVVFEARPQSASDTGLFLTVASNGIKAVRLLGADTRVLAAGFPTPRIDIRSTTGKRLGATVTGRVLADGTTTQSLGRTDLHHALRDEALECGIEIEHGRRLVDARERADAVVAVFDDGTKQLERSSSAATASTPPCGASSTPARRPPRSPACSTRPAGWTACRSTSAWHLRDDLRQARVLRLRGSRQRRGVVVRERAVPQRAGRRADGGRDGGRASPVVARALRRRSRASRNVDRGHGTYHDVPADPHDPRPPDVAHRSHDPRWRCRPRPRPRLARAPRWPSRTRSCSPPRCATLGRRERRSSGSSLRAGRGSSRSSAGPPG